MARRSCRAFHGTRETKFAATSNRVHLSERESDKSLPAVAVLLA